MAIFPKTVSFQEEGPREGFQIEKNFVPTARKIEFINALSKTGLKTIQIVSFVNPKLVLDLEALADCARLAEEVVGHPLPGSIMRGGSLQNLRAKAAA